MIADEDLCREWQEGSAGALEALVGRYHAPLLSHLFRLTGDVHLAQDLAQETFVRLVREAASYRYPRPFRPWLYAIARHLASNHWQSAYQRRVAVGATPPDVAGDEPDPAAWWERWERHAGLHTALATLSFEQRETLSLRFDQELSVEETAAVLAVPPGTVKSRTFTALRLLRDLLADAATNDQAPDQRGGTAHE